MDTLIKGAISGAISKTCASPFEVIKLNQQACGNSNVVQTINDIYQKNGWKGFFKGNMTNLYRVIPNYGLQFMFFNQYKQLLSLLNIDDTITNFTAGFMAGITSIAIVYPLETIRTYITVQRQTGLINTAKYIISNKGIRGLYRGINISLMNSGPYMGINFGMFNLLSEYFQPTGPLGNFMCGCGAGTASVLITYPSDLVRTTLHLNNKSLSTTIKHIYKKSGIKGFYNGMIITCFRVSVSMGVLFMCNKSLSNYKFELKL